MWFYVFLQEALYSAIPAAKQLNLL